MNANHDKHVNVFQRKGAEAQRNSTTAGGRGRDERPIIKLETAGIFQN
jgi:hypothetical protein